MKEKIVNWLEKHRYIYAVGLVAVSLCMVAFGLAGMGNDPTDEDVVATVSAYNQEDAEEFAAE